MCCMKVTPTDSNTGKPYVGDDKYREHLENSSVFHGEGLGSTFVKNLFRDKFKTYV